MARFTTNDGEMVEIVERYVIMAGMPTSASAPYGLRALVRNDDLSAREDLKANGFRSVAGQWIRPGRKAECAAEMARLVNECQFSIPGPGLVSGEARDLTREIRGLAGLTVALVFPNPLFS